MSEVKIEHKGRVGRFLNTYQSIHTRRNYRIGLTDFFSSVYKEKVVKKQGKRTRVERVEWLDAKAERYFSEDRDYERDVQEFLSSLNGQAPKTLRLKLAGVRVFLIENDVELSQKFWRRLSRKVKGSRALTLDKVPNNLQLRRLIMHMPIQGKALYLLLSSSGMRIGETLQLKLGDIDLDKTPMQIHIRGEYTKTGNPRHAFASKEAGEAIQEWFKVRLGYLEAAIKKSHLFEKETEDDRVFPFENGTAYAVWRNALRKAKMDERDKSTNFRKMHPHVLRKFFRTRLGSVIPVDVVEALMGHEGYLTEVYRRYSVEDLAKFYLKGESSLLVFTEAEEVSKLRVEVEESNRELQTLVNTLASKSMRLEEENKDLKHRIQMTEGKLSKLESEFAEVRKVLAELEQVAGKG